jgi:hypothetical protein
MHRLPILLLFAVALCGCSFYVPYVAGPHPLLVLPNGFKGEVFLLGDKERGMAWSGGPLVVPESGILRVANLKDLSAIRPDAFDAQYSSGKRIQNRNRGGNWDVDGLWPVMTMGDDHESTLVYFVVGSFNGKTVYENFRMLIWKETVQQLREGKKPNQPPEPTAMLVTPRAGARLAPSTTVAHL